MSQIGPCLSQMGPINAKCGGPDWAVCSSPGASSHTERDSHVTPEELRSRTGPACLGRSQHRLHSDRRDWPVRPDTSFVRGAGSRELTKVSIMPGPLGPGSDSNQLGAAAYSRSPIISSSTTGASLSSDTACVGDCTLEGVESSPSF